MENVALKLQVETENVPEFTRVLIEHEIDNEIIGHTEDDDIIIQIEYGIEQQDGVDELFEISEIFEEEEED
ncbi:MAG: hypothetical protein HRT73_07555 [Flavobacteriales bacterium]|nr:hypothetical protein [Flavobacteriales bacterium]